MSKLNIRKYTMVVLLALLAMFIFGCDNKTKVKDIYFAHEEQITMLVGEKLEPEIVVLPSYASNLKYTLISSDTNIVEVDGKKLIAKNVGDTLVKVVSNSNKNREDIIVVTVTETPTQLAAPTSLMYSDENETISFNSVNNAVGYTLVANDVQLELGNNNSITLEVLNEKLKAEGYNAGVYDNALKLKVKANASTHTKAFLNSEYSNSISIYKSGKVENLEVRNGLLQFDVKSNTKYDVSINGVKHDGLLEAGIPVDSLDASLEGKTISIEVVAKTINRNSANAYYNSKATSILVDVIKAPKISMSDTRIYWEPISKINKFELYINNVKKMETVSNFVDLAQIPYFKLEAETEYEAKVVPILNENSVNVAKTSKYSNIYFKKLTPPTITLNNNGFDWDRVLNAKSYQVQLSNIAGERLEDAQTLENSYSMLKYASNEEYLISIRANGGYDENSNTFYLTSTSIGRKFRKNVKVAPFIENYELKFESENNERYSIKIDNQEPVVKTSSGNQLNYNLKNITFDAGIHNIEIRHLGDNIQSIDGDKSYVSFIQLDKIDNFAIKDSVISAEEIAFNTANNAVVKIVVKDELGNIAKDQNGHNVEIDNLNLTISQSMLEAGNYTASVRVLGDGSKTFSYLKNGVESDCKTLTFKVLDAPVLEQNSNSETKLTFVDIPEATEYLVYKNDEYVETVNNAYYEYQLADGEQAEFKVVANNGTEYVEDVLISDYSAGIVVKKLHQPILSLARQYQSKGVYDCVENILSYTHENLAGVTGYELIINGETHEFDSVTNTLDIVDLLKVGNNTISLQMLTTEKNLINSDVTHFNSIVKLNNEASVTINTNNQLVIDTAENGKNDIFVNFDFGTKNLTFVGLGEKLAGGIMLENGVMSSYGKDLDYTFVNGKYIINLLNNDFTPIVEEMASDFDVSFIIFNELNSNVVASDVSNKTTINVLQKIAKSNIVRDGQTFKFNNLSVDRKVENYALLINDEDYFEIKNSATLDVATQIITLPISAVASLVTFGEINKLQIITKNNVVQQNNVALSVASEPVKFVIEPEVDLRSSKDNTAENNSVVISFDTVNTVYEKEYVVYIYNNEINDGVSKHYDTNTNSTVSFELDKETLEGTIKVAAYVRTEGTHTDNGDEVHHFDALTSNVLTFVKPAAPSNIVVKNGILTFENVEGAYGYEIYEQPVGQTWRKLSTSIVMSNNEFSLNSFGSKNIGIKVITKEQQGSSKYTNSSISEVVKVVKLSNPIISISDGDIKFDLLTAQYDSVSSINVVELLKEHAELVVTNHNGQQICFAINAEGKVTKNGVVSEFSKVEGTSLIISSYEILTYGNDSLLSEKITAYIRVNTNEVGETQYVNSDEKSENIHGLLEPLSVGKTTNMTSENEYVEHITWKFEETSYSNYNNTIDGTSVEMGYQFAIKYNENTYYSTDSKLKFLDNGNIKTYGNVITSLSCLFPYGYDANGENGIEEGEIFGAGTYEIFVRVLPTTKENYMLCGSKFGSACRFTIMGISTPRSENGEIVWDAVEGATAYIVKLTYSDLNGYEVSKFVTVEGTTYKLEESITGICKVQIQAINKSDDTIVNSAVSEEKEFFRLPTASSVWVDDGRLFIKANRMFTTAVIKFVDSNNTVKEIVYRNGEVGVHMITLGNKNFSEMNQATLNREQIFVIKIDDSDVLDLPQDQTYDIKVQLIGNSNNDPYYDKVRFLSSAQKDVEDFNVTKLKAESIFTVQGGVLTFSMTGDYSGNIDFHHNINNLAVADDFLKNTPIYKITISSSSDVDIYAIDYDVFKANETNLVNAGLAKIFTTQEISDLEISCLYGYYIYENNGTQIFINVFKNNQINLNNDYITYYNIDLNYSNGAYSWSGENATKKFELKNGGNFLVKANLLGGDINNGSAYLTSNQVTSKTFTKYGLNNLSTHKGLLRFVDLSSENDDPVYRIMMTDSYSTNFMLYLYAGTQSNADLIIGETGIPENTHEKVFVQITQDMYVKDGKDKFVQFAFNDYFAAGSYSMRIKTFAGLGKDGLTNDYLIDSKDEHSEQVFRQLKESEVKFSNGYLEFTRAYVVRDGVNTYYDDYEVLITDIVAGKDYKFVISAPISGTISDGVKVVGDKIRYNLPLNISGVTKLIENTHYTVKIRPIVANDLDKKVDVLNGNYFQENSADKTLKFRISSGTSNLQISDGKLIWKAKSADTDFSVRLYFGGASGRANSILINAGEIKFDSATQTYYHNFKDGANYLLEGTTSQHHEVTSGIEYFVELKSYSLEEEDEEYVLLSAPTETTLTRLAKVNDASIVSTSGVLTWNKVEGAVAYDVVLTLTVDGEETSTKYTYTTEVTAISDGNSLDLRTVKHDGNSILGEGVYTISIRAIGDDQITAVNSKAKFTNGQGDKVTSKFEKLGKVTNIELSEDGSQMSWDEVAGASRYEVVVNSNYQSDGSCTTSAPIIITTNSFILSDLRIEGITIHGKYGFVISALAQAGTSFTFNSDGETYISRTEAPEPVDKVFVDAENREYVWLVRMENLTNADKFIISYTLNNEKGNNDKIIENVSSDNGEIVSEWIEDVEIKYYQFKYVLTEIGTYSNFRVSIRRAGGTCTNPTLSTEEEFKFYPFKAGDGTSSDPYQIETEEHLLNIKLYTSANYILINNITISSSTIENYLIDGTRTGVISDVFSGSLNGKPTNSIYSIYFEDNEEDNGEDTEISLSNVGNFALFGELNSAKISNIIIGSSQCLIKFTNSFANDNQNVLNLSMLASKSVGETSLTDVELLNISYEIDITNQPFAAVYVSGLIGQMQQGEIYSCKVKNFNVNFSTNSSAANTYVAGIVASAKNVTKIEGTVIESMSVTQKKNGVNQNFKLGYVAGVVANIINDSGFRTTIDGDNNSIDITAEIQATYYGGVLANGNLTDIVDSVVLGEVKLISSASILRFGGIAGYVKDSNITNSNVQGVSFEVATVKNNQYIGGVVGYVDVENETSKVSGWSDNLTITTTKIVSNKVEVLGVCGYAHASTTIGA